MNGHHSAAGGRRRSASPAFTIIEIMVAVAIFSMVITAIYASWSAILRAARVGGDAAAEMQRTRIATRTLQDAFASAVMYTAHRNLYTFEVDTSEQFAWVSFVARLPASFPGSGYFGDQVVRRVNFEVARGDDGVDQLVLRQIPLLQTNRVPADDYQLVLAREVSTFALEFYDTQTGEWVGEWLSTNKLPSVVRFALAFGQGKANAKAAPETVRTVLLPCSAVPIAAQMPPVPRGPVGPGGPGGPPGGAGAARAGGTGGTAK